MNRRNLLAAALAAAALAPGGALAQAYPTKPVRVIVPYPAGGAVDSVARIFTERLSKMWGQPVIIDNKSGAGSNIGTAEAARAAADGHTLLVQGPAIVANPSLYTGVNWHPAKNFRALGVLAWAPLVAVVPEAIPAKSMKDFAALAEKEPKKLFYAAPGLGGGNNLSTQIFLQSAGVEMTPVQYKGQPEAVIDLVSNRINFMFAAPSQVIAHIKSGKLRALATMAPSRLDILPDVPTVAQAGYPAAARPFWFAMFTVAGTPDAVIDKIHADLAKLLETPEVRAGLAALGNQPATAMPRAEVDALIGGDTSTWHGVIKKAGIHAQ